MAWLRFRFSLATLVMWSFLAGGFLLINTSIDHLHSQFPEAEYGAPFNCAYVQLHPKYGSEVYQGKPQSFFEFSLPNAYFCGRDRMVRLNCFYLFGNFIALSLCMTAVNWGMNRWLSRENKHV